MDATTTEYLGVHIKTWTIVVGIGCLLVNFARLVFSVLVIVYTEGSHEYSFYVDLVFSVLYTLTAALLLYGLMKMRAKLLMPHLILTMIAGIHCTLQIIILIVFKGHFVMICYFIVLALLTIVAFVCVQTCLTWMRQETDAVSPQHASHDHPCVHTPNTIQTTVVE